MITVYISIGNSDDKLSQADWSLFAANVRHLLKSHSVAMHGEWYSLPDAQFQNACWCIEVRDRDQAELLKMGLGQWAQSYRQDSIAWAEAPRTEFISGTERAGDGSGQ